MIFCQHASELKLLFIERASSPQDPWSGHMAFPGGRRDVGDGSLQDAAEREVLEEIGIQLQNQDFLGRFDDMHGRHAGKRIGLVISSFVYFLEYLPETVANHEVEEVLWVPVANLLDQNRRVAYKHPLDDNLSYPGIKVGWRKSHVVWGLTYRFLYAFFNAAQIPLPEPLPETCLR